MSKREHNRQAIRDWLDGTLPFFMPGGAPTEEYYDDSSKRGQEPLTERRLEVLDHPDWGPSHHEMWRFFFEVLPQRSRVLYRAAHDVYLSENSGGYANMEAMRGRVDLSERDEETLFYAEKVFELAVEYFTSRCIWLSAKSPNRIKIREQHRDHGRQERARNLFLRHRKHLGDDRSAIEETAKESGYSESWMYAMTEDLRKP